MGLPTMAPQYCGILMIRLFSVLCKLNQIRFSDRQWFEWESGKMLPPDHPCPHCQAKGCLEPFAHYERYLVEWDGTAPVCHDITVPRYVCQSCGRTHAGLPSCLVPYRSYALRFILIVLRDYFIRVSSVEQLCRKYAVSTSTLYRWIRLFQCQKALWLGVLEDGALCAGGFLAGLDGAFLQDFYQSFHFSFLESFHRTDMEPPSRNGVRMGGIT